VGAGVGAGVGAAVVGAGVGAAVVGAGVGAAVVGAGVTAGAKVVGIGVDALTGIGGGGFPFSIGKRVRNVILHSAPLEGSRFSAVMHDTQYQWALVN